MEQVLLVWEMRPEYVNFYLFEDGSYNAELARQSSGKMIGGDDLEEDDPIYELDLIIGDLAPHPLDELVNLEVIAVYHCGVLL